LTSTPTARDRSAWLTPVATLTGNLYLVVGTLFFALLSIAVALLPPFGRHVHHTARMWARGVLWASWVRLAIERAPATDPRGRYVFLANHQSLFDIPALLAAIPARTLFLAKASLFRIPVFGWAMRMGGFVPVDREDRAHARRSFDSAIARLEQGASVLLFPEETRTLDGRLLPFRRGGLLLALKSGLPIVPVGVEGTLAVQSRRSFLIRPRIVHVRFGAPVETAGASVRKLGELSERLRAEVASLARTTLSENPVTEH
jgi:1-acyl-sn-glycerol-3-phosphate acyltransferase